MLRGEDGNWIDSLLAIELQIINYFKDVFKSCPSPLTATIPLSENIDLVLRELNLPQISNPDALRLSTPFSSLEIKAAMFSISDDK